MQDSKLILLLKTFNKEDWRWFRKFLVSPYFNNRKELVLLYDYLRIQSPNFKEASLKKEKIFKKVFPNQSFDEKMLGYSISYLLAQAERFICQRRFENTPPLLNNCLLGELVERQLDKNYKFHYEKVASTLEKYEVENSDYYLYKYQLSEIGDLHFSNQNIRKSDNHLQETYLNLNHFYFLNILKHACIILTKKNALQTNDELPFIDAIIQYLEKNDNNLPPITLLYLKIFNAFNKENTEVHFENLKKLLAQFNDQIPFAEKRDIYLHAINYCIIQATKNHNAKYYLEQMLDFYLLGIEEAFLLNKGFLTPWTFKNVIKLGLTLKRFDFTENFIQEYHLKLEEEFRADALHFNLADLNYRKKKYHIAQTHLIQVQFSDIFYNLGAKTMLLKIYYETEEIEALLALIASFSIYLRRNKKIAKNTKESYLNFTTILAKIIRSPKNKLPKVVERINQTSHLYNRRWLLEVCNHQ